MYILILMRAKSQCLTQPSWLALIYRGETRKNLLAPNVSV